MTAESFNTYLANRLAHVRAHKDQYPGDTEANIVSMQKIMALGGRAARRVRRDYERRLAKSGKTLEA